jgi:mRNA interferase RelE/StbE
MGSYRLLFKRSVARDLCAIPAADVERLLARIADLAGNPRPPGCQKLSAQERYRLRAGRYRVVYEIRDRELVVLIVKVADRKDAYRH